MEFLLRKNSTFGYVVSDTRLCGVRHQWEGSISGNTADKKADTIKLFDEINEGKYIAYTSNYVLQELLKAEEPKRSDMVGLIEKYK